MRCFSYAAFYSCIASLTASLGFKLLSVATDRYLPRSMDAGVMVLSLTAWLIAFASLKAFVDMLASACGELELPKRGLVVGSQKGATHLMGSLR